jgi:hypothetical protein
MPQGIAGQGDTGVVVYSGLTAAARKEIDSRADHNGLFQLDLLG